MPQFVSSNKSNSYDFFLYVCMQVFMYLFIYHDHIWFTLFFQYTIHFNYVTFNLPNKLYSFDLQNSKFILIKHLCYHHIILYFNVSSYYLPSVISHGPYLSSLDYIILIPFYIAQVIILYTISDSFQT